MRVGGRNRPATGFQSLAHTAMVGQLRNGQWVESTDFGHSGDTPCPANLNRRQVNVLVQARAGNEPTYTELQSAAWPLFHRALEQNLRGRGRTLRAAGEGVKAMARRTCRVAKRLFFRGVAAITGGGVATAAWP